MLIYWLQKDHSANKARFIHWHRTLSTRIARHRSSRGNVGGHQHRYSTLRADARLLCTTEICLRDRPFWVISVALSVC
jgi:hypothetical protein